MNDSQRNICILVSHLMSQDICTIVYRDRDNVVSVRYIRVHGIEKAANGRHYVRAYDTQRGAPRSFRIAAIQAVFAGTPTFKLTPEVAHVPKPGDTVRLHYTGWPDNCKPIEHSAPFTWDEDVPKRMTEGGWTFTIEKVEG